MKSNKILKLEKNRISIFTDDLSHCILCNQPDVDINEIFPGRNRQNSMKYGLCIPLCRKHHNQYHLQRSMQLQWMRLAQNEFEKTHTRDEWINIFLKNYKD